MDLGGRVDAYDLCVFYRCVSGATIAHDGSDRRKKAGMDEPLDEIVQIKVPPRDR